MLNHLSISSLTLVDQLELEFSRGMSVITGETGAGKSIMLGALGLALGDRADSSLVAKDAAKAEICASFDLAQSPAAKNWLEAKALLDADNCILRRVVGKDGRSRAFVNGSAVTLTELRELSEMLLDIHSQHEHQSLLKRETHRRLLDEYGGLGEVVLKLTSQFDRMKSIRDELNQLKADAEEQSARVQLLSYQAEELNNLALMEGEIVQLEADQKRLNNAEESHQALSAVIDLCSKESDASASSLTARGLTLLNSIEDKALGSARELLESAVIQLDEAMHDLSLSLERYEDDPEQLRQIDSRLNSIYEIARKHRVTPEQLPALAQDLQAELEQIINVDGRIEELAAQLNEATSAYRSLAEKLSDSRQKTAQTLQEEVTAQLQALGMSGSAFRIAITEADGPSRFGIDDIEFQIATIPSSDPGPLSRIASGGELSRISLAIQVVTAVTSDTPTLVFDEVDVGVGGATAEVVGGLLRKLGGSTQVICVTHLPQVAAQGHHHYVVKKETSTSGAETSVLRLNEEEKVDEIARMLGGVERTSESLAHAQSMLATKP